MPVIDQLSGISVHLIVVKFCFLLRGTIYADSEVEHAPFLVVVFNLLFDCRRDKNVFEAYASGLIFTGMVIGEEIINLLKEGISIALVLPNDIVVRVLSIKLDIPLGHK